MSSGSQGSIFSSIDDFDRSLMERVRPPQGALRWALLGLTVLGSAVLTLPAELVGWLFAPALASRWFGLCLLADVPGHLLLIVPIRYLTRRQRPTPFEKPPLGFDPWNVWSFPSAHSLRVWTLATILSHAWPAWWVACVALAAVITATRICLRRHFPSDIAVGALLGFAWGSLLLSVLPGGIPLP